MHISRISIVMIGNVLYHFDRALFNLLIPFLVPVFFPQVTPIFGLIYLYAIGPLGLITKPLGAILFGYLGDRLGTQKILSITLFGMAIKTGMMGFLPSYEQVGILSPLLLTVTRLAISFFSGGETTGGAIALFEQSHPKKRNLMSALFDASGILGVLLASCSVWALHSHDGFWRILFWGGSIIGVIGWSIRKSSLKEPSQERYSPPPIRTLWEHRRIVLGIALLAGFSYGNYYLITNFMNGFLPIISSITKAQAISLNSLLLLLDFFFLPIFGLVSLKIRKETLILFSILGIVLFCAPLFLFLKEATLFKAGFVRIFLMIFGVLLAAPFHAWVFERTPPNHRYLIGAFSTAIGGRLFGSPILPIGLWLYHQTGLIIAPAFPIILLGSFSLIYFLKEEFITDKKPFLET